MLWELYLMPIKKIVPKMSHLVTSKRMRRGQRRNVATLLFSCYYLRWPGRGRYRNKKAGTNEVPWDLEISWSHHLILFSKEPFNFPPLSQPIYCWWPKCQRWEKVGPVHPSFFQSPFHMSCKLGIQCSLPASPHPRTLILPTCNFASIKHFSVMYIVLQKKKSSF